MSLSTPLVRARAAPERVEAGRVVSSVWICFAERRSEGAALPSALSVDLRERVVSALKEGASRRQAAKRFGVSPASAMGWHESFAQEGRIAPKPQGGDQRSHRIEAHAELIRQPYQAHPQIVLRDLRDALQEQSVKVSTSRLSRVLARHALTRQKGQHTRLSRTGRM